MHSVRAVEDYYDRFAFDEELREEVEQPFLSEDERELYLDSDEPPAPVTPKTVTPKSGKADPGVSPVGLRGTAERNQQ